MFRIWRRPTEHQSIVAAAIREATLEAVDVGDDVVRGELDARDGHRGREAIGLEGAEIDAVVGGAQVPEVHAVGRVVELVAVGADVDECLDHAHPGRGGPPSFASASSGDTFGQRVPGPTTIREQAVDDHVAAFNDFPGRARDAAPSSTMIRRGSR